MVCMMSLLVWLPAPMFLSRVFVSGPISFQSGVSIQWGLCPGVGVSGQGLGGSLSRWSLSRGLCQGDPPGQRTPVW